MALCCLGGGSLAVLGSVLPQAAEAPTTTKAPVRNSPAADVAPTESASPWASPSPKVETTTVSKTQAIPYGHRTVYDSSLAEGSRKVRVKGVPGIKTLTYEITLTDGVQTGKRLVKETITRKPVAEVVAIGTKKQKQCDPNYSGACVPIASDVDCAGGSGNGPAYVQGPLRVIGYDIYDLDRDGDGIACD